MTREFRSNSETRLWQVWDQKRKGGETKENKGRRGFRSNLHRKYMKKKRHDRNLTARGVTTTRRNQKYVERTARKKRKKIRSHWARKEVAG